LARFPVETHPAPIVHAVGRVGILLDLQNQITAVNRMDGAAVNEDRIAGLHRKAVHAAIKGLIDQRPGELAAGGAGTQADDEAGVARRVGDVPVFGLWLAFEGGRDVRRWMHLKAEALAAVEPLDQDRKRRSRRPLRAHDLLTTPLDRLTQRKSVEGAAGNDGLGLGPIDHFPAFANRPVRRKSPAKRGLKHTTAPDPVLIKGLETKHFIHWTLQFIVKIPSGRITFDRATPYRGIPEAGPGGQTGPKHTWASRRLQTQMPARQASSLPATDRAGSQRFAVCCSDSGLR